MPDADLTTDEMAQAVLLVHQRRDIRGCNCGWAKLGQTHAGHQVDMLREAGVLRDGVVQAAL